MLLTSVATAFQATPDRTGEAQLKALIQGMSKLNSIHLMITVESRTSLSDAFYYGRTFDLNWGLGGRFRIGISDYWGDARSYVSDGRTLMKDSLDSQEGVELRDFDRTAMDSSEELAARGAYALATIYLLSGESGLAKLAPPESTITFKDGVIHLSESPFGNMAIHTELHRGMLRATKIEYDNWPWKESMYEQYPEWWDPPLEGTLDVETLTWLSSGSKRDTFRVNPPKGMRVNDLRTKKVVGPAGLEPATKRL